MYKKIGLNSMFFCLVWKVGQTFITNVDALGEIITVYLLGICEICARRSQEIVLLSVRVKFLLSTTLKSTHIFSPHKTQLIIYHVRIEYKFLESIMGSM